QKGTGTAQKQPRVTDTAAQQKSGSAERSPAAESETLRVEMLGGARVEQQRFYLLQGEERPRTLEGLQEVLAERRKQKPPLRSLEIVIYENSVAAEHPAVKDLEKWAREHDLAVTLTFPKRDLP